MEMWPFGSLFAGLRGGVRGMDTSWLRIGEAGRRLDGSNGSCQGLRVVAGLAGEGGLRNGKVVGGCACVAFGSLFDEL